MPGVITLSQVPLSAVAASELLNDIRVGKLEPHPSHHDEIMLRIEQVIAGIYVSSEVAEEVFNAMYAEDKEGIAAAMKLLTTADLEHALSKFLSQHCSVSVAVTINNFQLKSLQNLRQGHRLSLDMDIERASADQDLPF